MQPFETATLLIFLVSYLYNAIRCIATPEQYRAAEVAFYKTGKAQPVELLMMLLGASSVIPLVLHFMFEGFRFGQLLLYAQVILFLVVLPMHFIAIARKRMSKTLGAKSNADYRNSGYKKLLIAAVMIALPLIVRN